MTLFQDVRHAVRALARTRGVTLVAALSLALGIGLTSTVFSLMDGMWLRPLPGVREPGALVRLFATGERDRQAPFSWGDYLDLAASAKSFSGLVSIQRRGPLLTVGDSIEPTMTHIVSPNFFTLLGVNAQRGRVFSEADPGELAMVISHNLWQSRFGADPGVVGRTVRLGRIAFTICGVAPKGFRGTELWFNPDLWISQGAWDAISPGESKMRAIRQYELLGRLRPGVDADTARAELSAVASNLAKAYPDTNKGWGATALSAREYQLKTARYFHVAALGGILLAVLLIACANVANLLLVRGEARQREIAIRLAIGSSRGALIRQLLIESLLIALLGMVLALLLAAWLVEVLPTVLPVSDFVFRVDTRVVVFTLGVTVLTATLSGLVPSLRASRPDVVSAIKGESQSGRERFAVRHALVVAQIALSMTMLVSGGLLTRSFMNALRADFGFEHKNILVVRTSPLMREEPARVFYRQLVERVSGLPGVKRAALARRAPLWPSEGGVNDQISVPGQPPARVKFNTVEPAYFATLGIRILRGRGFDERDSAAGTKTAIISETMARRFFPDTDPVGRLFRTRNGTDRQIVGVARDAKINSFEEMPEPYFYLPYSQDFYSSMSLLVETNRNPMDFVPMIKSQIAQLAKMPAPDIDTMDHLVRDKLSNREGLAALVGGLALAGLMLAAAGLYGVMSYLVTRRTREIGIRMAVGAGKRQTVALVLGRSLKLAGIGIALGAGCAVACSSLLSGMIYGVSPRDPLTLSAVAALLALVALAAAAAPALRATRVDPVAALRME